MYLSNQLVYSGCLKCGSDAVAKRVLQLPNRHNINTQILEASPWLTEVVDSSLTKSVVFLDTEQVSLYEMHHEKHANCMFENKGADQLCGNHSTIYTAHVSCVMKKLVFLVCNKVTQAGLYSCRS